MTTASTAEKPPVAIIRDSVSGGQRVIENPLRAEHIKEGAYLWYDGSYSLGSWNCPAVITQVDFAKRCFRIRSLDNCAEQHQWFSFDMNESSPASRKTMRIVPYDVVQRYIDWRKKELEESIEFKRKQYENSKTAFEGYEAEIKKLGIDIEQPTAG